MVESTASRLDSLEATQSRVEALAYIGLAACVLIVIAILVRCLLGPCRRWLAVRGASPAIPLSDRDLVVTPVPTNPFLSPV